MMNANLEQISQYNLPAEKRYAISNLFMFVSKRLKMEGFIVGDKNFGPKHYKEHQEKMQAWYVPSFWLDSKHMTDLMQARRRQRQGQDSHY